MNRTLLSSAIAALLLIQPLSAQQPSLVLRGPRGDSVVLATRDIAALPHREVSASAHGVSGRYRGVDMNTLLRRVGAPLGDSLRGAALASYVLVEAADGYRVTFTLPDFDSGFTDRISILADMRDGAALDAHDGPFQLIVPDEKRPARWVRQVTRISVARLPSDR